MFAVVKRALWDAWKTQEALSQAEAQAAYIALIDHIPDWVEESSR